mmetsp:Transcript_10013/g.40694  ORF Transcript_10013/g.40694 Transcript_10013/m.40694 type:complete len:307 (+) Transcript_10013:1331-2251(+)
MQLTGLLFDVARGPAVGVAELLVGLQGLFGVVATGLGLGKGRQQGERAAEVAAGCRHRVQQAVPALAADGDSAAGHVKLCPARPGLLPQQLGAWQARRQCGNAGVDFVQDPGGRGQVALLDEQSAEVQACPADVLITAHAAGRAVLQPGFKQRPGLVPAAHVGQQRGAVDHEKAAVVGVKRPGHLVGDRDCPGIGRVRLAARAVSGKGLTEIEPGARHAEVFGAEQGGIGLQGMLKLLAGFDAPPQQSQQVAIVHLAKGDDVAVRAEVAIRGLQAIQVQGLCRGVVPGRFIGSGQVVGGARTVLRA